MLHIIHGHNCVRKEMYVKLRLRYNIMEKTIILAGGCFWGLERYFSLLKGVVNTEVGYANGNQSDTNYYDIKKTHHAEAVKVVYDTDVLTLQFILELFFEAIDPTSLNKQGNDVGVQYRSGIYYTDKDDLPIIESALQKLAMNYEKPIVIEVALSKHYVSAEHVHQNYLVNNPNGYCHIGKKHFDYIMGIKVDPYLYTKKNKEDLKNELSDLQYKVTQEAATERPFANTFSANFERGIYVDITSGEPLFSSSDKFESGCGWPSFSRPI